MEIILSVLVRCYSKSWYNIAMSYQIYKATSPSGKSYIGVTNNFARRKASHIRFARNGSNIVFHTAIRKYGAEAFLWETLIDGLSADEAFALEIRLIAELDLTNRSKGYNMQQGGEHISWTDEIREHHKIGVNTDKCRISRKQKYEEKRVDISNTISTIARQNSIDKAKPFYAYDPVSNTLQILDALFQVKSTLNLKPESVHVALRGKSSYYKGYIFRYIDEVNDIDKFKLESQELIRTRYERMALSRAKAIGIKATNLVSNEIKIYQYIGDFVSDMNGVRHVIIAALNGRKNSYKGWKLEYIR